MARKLPLCSSRDWRADASAGEHVLFRLVLAGRAFALAVDEPLAGANSRTGGNRRHAAQSSSSRGSDWLRKHVRLSGSPPSSAGLQKTGVGTPVADFSRDPCRKTGLGTPFAYPDGGLRRRALDVGTRNPRSGSGPWLPAPAGPRQPPCNRGPKSGFSATRAEKICNRDPKPGFSTWGSPVIRGSPSADSLARRGRVRGGIPSTAESRLARDGRPHPPWTGSGRDSVHGGEACSPWTITLGERTRHGWVRGGIPSTERIAVVHGGQPRGAEPAVDGYVAESRPWWGTGRRPSRLCLQAPAAEESAAEVPSRVFDMGSVQALQPSSRAARADKHPQPSSGNPSNQAANNLGHWKRKHFGRRGCPLLPNGTHNENALTEWV